MGDKPFSVLPAHGQAERLARKPAVIDHRPDGTSLIWSCAELNRQANRLTKRRAPPPGHL
jgi:hypothetical protein